MATSVDLFTNSLIRCLSHSYFVWVIVLRLGYRQGQEDPCFPKFSYCFCGWGDHGPGGEFLVSVKQKRKAFLSFFFFNDQLRYADSVKGNKFYQKPLWFVFPLIQNYVNKFGLTLEQHGGNPCIIYSQPYLRFLLQLKIQPTMDRITSHGPCNQPWTTDCRSIYYWKQSMHKWTLAVQTCVVQGSSV